MKRLRSVARVGVVCWIIILWTGCAFSQVVTGFYPEIGSVGEPVRINGVGFGTDPRTPVTVKFSAGGASTVVDTTAQRTSDSIIYGHVPAGAQTGPITVQVGTGSGSSLKNFTVVGLGPYISDVSPEFGAYPDLIVISGWHLTNGSPYSSTAPKVTFNGVAASEVVPYTAGDTLSVRVPAGASSGPLAVITKGTGAGTNYAPVPFTVTGAGPYISGFNPQIGNAGTLVNIAGVHFTGVTNVTFNGKTGTNLVLTSDTLLTINAPPGVTSGKVSVTSPKGKSTSADLFYVPPVMTGFTPGFGRAGTNVVLSGTNLLGTLEVLFNNSPAAFSTPTNNNTLYAVAPTNTSTGAVRINTPAGSYITNVFRFLPTVSSFSPGAGPPGTMVTLLGANLNEGISAVIFGGATNKSPVNPAFGQVSATVPATATNGPLTVVTTNGTFTTFSNYYLPPVITSYVPKVTSPPGTTLTFTGQNLVGTTNVTFNGWPARFTPPTNNTTLFAVVPTNVTSGPVFVTTPAGTAQSTNFYAVPIITDFSPTNGLPGQFVTIRGTNFLDASAVRFKDALGQIQSNNGGILVAVLPPDAKTGPVTVTAPAGTATSSIPFIVDFASRLNLTVSATPNPVFVTSNLVYQMVVTNAGPFDAPHTLLQDTLPSSLVLRSNSISGGTLTINGNQLTADFGLLRISNSVSLVLTVSPTTPGLIENTATVSSDYPDPAPEDNSVTVANFALPLPLLVMRNYSPSLWRISWPLLLTNYALQYVPELGTNSAWTNLTTSPTIEGNEKFVIETTTEDGRLYRLRK